MQGSVFSRAVWVALLLAVGGCRSSSKQSADAAGIGGSGIGGSGSGGSNVGGGSGAGAGVVGGQGGGAGASVGGSGGSVGGSGGTNVGGRGGAGAGAGQGGGAGAPVGGSGGNANACLPSSPVYPQLALGSIGGLVGPYDGPAIVERSVGGELTLAYAPPGSGGGGASGGGAGGNPGTLQHVRISGLETAATLPPGARVWLSKGQEPTGGFVAPQPRSFAIRSGQGGTLLMGAALNEFTAVSSPVAIGGSTAVCTTSVAAGGCLPAGSTETYSEVSVSGDSPVVIRDGTPGEIVLGGVRYDVRVQAQMTTVAQGPLGCADYFPFAGVSLDVRAKNLAALAAGLTVGPGPACGQGNDARSNVSFGVYEVSLPDGFEGPVTYAGLDPLKPGAYAFDIPGRPPLSNGGPARLYIANAASLLSAPAVGQQFWLSYPSWRSQALLESQGGPLVIAQASGMPPAAVLAPLAAGLGVDVTLERACSYGSALDLYRARFATTPAVTVPSGTTALVTVGGRNYRAWMWNEYSFTLTVVRAD